MIRTRLPAGTRWTTSSAVIIFVSDAIGSTRVGSWRHSTRPVSRSNSSPERGGFLKRRLTRSPAPSSRTASVEGAVPPPASGSGAPSTSEVDRGAVARCGALGSSRDVRRNAAPAAQASTTSSASRRGQRRRRRLRPPWCTS